MRRTARATVFIVGALVGLAGAAGPALGQAVGTSDSAGVVIVTTLEPPVAQWSLAEEPVWTIGGRPDDPPLYEVVGVVAVDTSRVVIANGGGHELLVYEGGALRSSMGRAGGGPGEFEDLSGIGSFRGDSVYAFDFHQARLSIFDVAGGVFTRGFRLDSYGELGGYAPKGTLSDGRLVLTSDAAMLGGSGQTGRDSTYAVIVSPEGAPLDTLGRFPKSDLGMPPGSFVFGARAVWAAGGDRIYRSYGSDYSIREYAPDGELRRIFRIDASPFVVTEDRWDTWVEARLASFDGNDARDREMRRRMRQELERVTHADVLPSFDRMLLDDAGRVWAREHPMAGVRDARWLVFDRTGQWIATVRLPDRFRLLDIHGDRIIGVQRDALDVERIVAYRMVR